MGLYKYWKSPYMMASKFEKLTVPLKVNKSAFHNSLHNTALSFDYLDFKYEAGF